MSSADTNATCEITPDDKSEVTREGISFASADKKSTCRGFIWWPTQPTQPTQTSHATHRSSEYSSSEHVAGPRPKACIQLMHGMTEHIARYERFAHALCAHGFVVCGIDHIGHGQTTPDPSQRGVYDPQTAATQIVEDQQSLRKLMQQRLTSKFGLEFDSQNPVGGQHETIPYVLFGHSMGSFVVRAYLTRYGKGLAAAIIMGTAWQPAPEVSKALISMIAAVKGWSHRSSFVNNLGTGGYNAQISLTPDEKLLQQQGTLTGYEWLSHDTREVQAYADDPACGWMFSLSGYKMVLDLVQCAQRSQNIQNIPHKLPIYIISGEEDPVGRAGSGPVQTFRAYRKAGLDHTELQIIAHARHELLHETTAASTTAELIDWIDGVIKKPVVQEQ